MTRLISSLLLVTVLGLFIHVASAQAEYVRTCVSMLRGDDANTCHCSQPCRTFVRAHNQTFPDGEITVLDPGDYGGLTITKSISIVNDNVGEASISVSGGTTGIIVNAPAAGYVNLRGITIQGVGFGGGIGLRFNTGFSLTITNCVVRNHTGNGIEFFPNASSNLAVSKTLVADNGRNGIYVHPQASGTVKAVFNRVEVYNNSRMGIFVDAQFFTGTINATVAESVAANNLSGINLIATESPGSLMVTRSVVANNVFDGLVASGAAATLRVGQSTATGNRVGVEAAGDGTVLSYGDNYLDGNVSGNVISATIPKK